MSCLQKFASVHANVHNHFNFERHLIDKTTYKTRRSAALAEWSRVQLIMLIKHIGEPIRENCALV